MYICMLRVKQWETERLDEQICNINTSLLNLCVGGWVGMDWDHGLYLQSELDLVIKVGGWLGLISRGLFDTDKYKTRL